MLQRNVGHAANYILGAIERRAIRQLREGDEISLVLRGNKSRGHMREAQNGKPNQPRVDHDSDYARTQRVRYKLSITARRTAKETVEQFEKPSQSKIDGTREAIFF